MEEAVRVRIIHGHTVRLHPITVGVSTVWVSNPTGVEGMLRRAEMMGRGEYVGARFGDLGKMGMNFDGPITR